MKSTKGTRDAESDAHRRASSAADSPTPSPIVRTIDRLIPERILRDDDVETLRQARSIIGFAAVLSALAIETAWYFHAHLARDVALPIETVIALSMLGVLLTPLALDRFASTAVAANILIGGSFASILAVLVALGGIKAPLVHWCGLPPMLALLMGARRSAWLWAGLGSATVVGFILLDARGLGFTNHLAPVIESGGPLWFQRSIDVFSWLVMLLTTAFLYERHKDQQTEALARANEGLRREMNQRRRAEERTRYLAYYDELTTLPNRQLFKEQLAQAMDAADRDGRMVGLLFLDLDGFKEINDTHGHSTGDELLQQVSSRLLGCVRGVDRVSRQTEQDAEFVSRLGGDEFTILLDRLSDYSEAAIVAERVIGGLAAPFRLDDREVYVSASIGIALYAGHASGPGHPDSVTTLDELLCNADLAMYHAKKQGRNNYQFFEATMNEMVVERTTLAHALRLAVERDELELHYQPILAATTGEIVAVECLVRWDDAGCGLVDPARFVAVAEQSGLITELGQWVLREACAQFACWQEEGIAPGRIAVNISGQQFRARHLTRAVIEIVRQTKIDPRCVELELTETAMMINEAEASQCLEDLKRFGVSVALDDFGTGYSSLSYIRRFPVDALKIDRSFIEVIESNPEARAITTAILAMARSLDLRVVAEGVETESQRTLLAREGCDELQGYLFSEPIPAGEMTALLRRDPVRPRPPRDA